METKHKWRREGKNDMICGEKGKEGYGYGYAIDEGVDNPPFICIQFCPECNLENYAPSVASGTCAWCHYIPN